MCNRLPGVTGCGIGFSSCPAGQGERWQLIYECFSSGCRRSAYTNEKPIITSFTEFIPLADTLCTQSSPFLLLALTHSETSVKMNNVLQNPSFEHLSNSLATNWQAIGADYVIEKECGTRPLHTRSERCLSLRVWLACLAVL